MKKRIIFISILLVVVLSSVTIGLSMFGKKKSEEQSKILPLSTCVIPSQTIYSKKKLVNMLTDNTYGDSIKSNNLGDSLELYFSAGNAKLKKCNEYKVTDNSISTTYQYGNKKMYFIWEYGVTDAELLLQNTIEQFSLVKISSSPDLYTYIGWKDLESELIDIFWVQNDLSFIANVPKNILENNRQDVIQFCNATKESIVADTNLSEY